MKLTIVKDQDAIGCPLHDAMKGAKDMAKEREVSLFQEFVNRTARRADTPRTKINVAEVSRVLSMARDELFKMMGGK